MLKKKIAAVAIAVATVGGVALATPAQAATTSVSGTVYSDGSWYLSSTVRSTTVSTTQLSLPSRPSRNIYWRLYSTNKGTYYAGPVELTNNGTYTIATSVLSGTRFQNSYKDGAGSCAAFCNYNFSGTLTY